jgi:hypothetical protein
MNNEMTLDKLGELASSYKALIAEKANETAVLHNRAEFETARKLELWPNCLNQLRDAIASVNAKLTGTHTGLKLTNNPQETMMQRECSNDRFELLFCSAGIVHDNWLIEVDARGNISVQLLKRESSPFVSATTVAQLDVVESTRKKWQDILTGFASKRLESLMER